MPQLSSLAHQCQEAAPVHDFNVTFNRGGPEVGETGSLAAREEVGVSTPTVDDSMSMSSASMEFDWSVAWGEVVRVFQFFFTNTIFKEFKTKYLRLHTTSESCKVTENRPNQQRRKDKHRFVRPEWLYTEKKRERNTLIRSGSKVELTPRRGMGRMYVPLRVKTP